MIKLTAEATITYTIFLSEEQEEYVRNYAEENDLDIDEVEYFDLFTDGELDIYNDGADVTESEHSTEAII